MSIERLEAAIGAMREASAAELRPSVDEAAVDGLKFSQCLPPELAVQMLEMRLLDLDGLLATLSERVRFVT